MCRNTFFRSFSVFFPCAATFFTFFCIYLWIFSNALPEKHCFKVLPVTTEMADVDVQVQYTTTKVRKTKKSSSSAGKRRESSDQGSEVTITEVQDKENFLVNGKGYVSVIPVWPPQQMSHFLIVPSTLPTLPLVTMLVIHYISPISLKSHFLWFIFIITEYHQIFFFGNKIKL